jgi:hypothetical protein
MSNSMTFEWLATLVIFICFVGGGFYFYQKIQKEAHVREFNTCIDHAGRSRDSWTRQSQISLCQNLYSTSATGRYGPQSDMTISLAMVQRPIF